MDTDKIMTVGKFRRIWTNIIKTYANALNCEFDKNVGPEYIWDNYGDNILTDALEGIIEPKSPVKGSIWRYIKNVINHDDAMADFVLFAMSMNQLDDTDAITFAKGLLRAIVDIKFSIEAENKSKDIPETYINEFPSDQGDFEKVLYQGIRRYVETLGVKGIIFDVFDDPNLYSNNFIGKAQNVWYKYGISISEYLINKYKLEFSAKDYVDWVYENLLGFEEYEIYAINNGIEFAKRMIWDGKEISITEFAKRFVSMPLAIYSMRNQLIEIMDDDNKKD